MDTDVAVDSALDFWSGSYGNVSERREVVKKEPKRVSGLIAKIDKAERDLGIEKGEVSLRSKLHKGISMTLQGYDVMSEDILDESNFSSYSEEFLDRGLGAEKRSLTSWSKRRNNRFKSFSRLVSYIDHNSEDILEEVGESWLLSLLETTYDAFLEHKGFDRKIKAKSSVLYDDMTEAEMVVDDLILTFNNLENLMRSVADYDDTRRLKNRVSSFMASRRGDKIEKLNGEFTSFNYHSEIKRRANVFYEELPGVVLELKAA